MAEVSKIPLCGLTAASTFSGAGGSSLGYRMAGIKVAWASEFVEAARETYAANFPDAIVDPRDVREVKGADVLRALGLRQGQLDVFDGSPPCSAFSTAGRREKGWNEVKDYSDGKKQVIEDLFFEYARLVGEIRPRAFVAENVAGLVRGTAKGYFLEILKELKGRGYRVSARVLDAQWLGVPQVRRRVIFVGFRDDLGVEPSHPTPLPYRYTVRDALPHVLRQMPSAPYGTSGWNDAASAPSQTIGASPNTGNGRSPASVVEARRVVRVSHDTGGQPQYSAGDVTDRPSPTVMTSPSHFQVYEEARMVHDTSGIWSTGDVTDSPCPTVTVGVNSVNSNHYQIHTPRQVAEASMEGYAVGEEWEKLRPGEQSEKYFSLVRPRTDRPCPTVTARGGDVTAASVTHPTEKRKLTIPELKRICSFPDDFVLTGSYAQQWERCGRAVPPLMMRAVAEVVRDKLLALDRARGKR